LFFQAAARILFVPSLHAQLVVDGRHALRPILVGHQDTAIGGVGSGPGAPRYAPGIANHQLEIIISVNGCAQSLVVVLEFSKGHGTVTIHIIPLPHKLPHGLFDGLFTGLHFRVMGEIIYIHHFLHSNVPRPVFVQNVEGHTNHIPSSLIQITFHPDQKFAHIQDAIAISIKVMKHFIKFSNVKLDTIVLQAELQFVFGQSFVSIVVHNRQCSLEPLDPRLFPTALQDLLDNSLHHPCCALCHLVNAKFPRK